MKIVIGADHAGFELKETLRQALVSQGHDVVDVGTHSAERVDYPDIAHDLAHKVAAKDFDRGVLVCGSGIGMAIAANRTQGVRAVNCTMEYHAAFSRGHNDANVICLGARVVGDGLAESMIKIFLETSFEGGRHSGRVDKLDVAV